MSIGFLSDVSSGRCDDNMIGYGMFLEVMFAIESFIQYLAMGGHFLKKKGEKQFNFLPSKCRC
jgi:hypothetical protein